jgi:hypothetical protein
LSHLSDAERRAYILADNKLVQNAGWDREILALELQGLLDFDFEVDLTGIGLAECANSRADSGGQDQVASGRRCARSRWQLPFRCLSYW